PAAPAKSAQPANPGAATPPAKSRMLPWVIVIVLLLTMAGGAAFWFLNSGKPAGAKPLAQARYIALDPAFVVNLADQDGTRYLQVDVQLQVRDPDTATAV